MKIFRIIASAFASILLVLGCRPGDQVNKYGTAFNSERLKRGIPTIPSGWSVTDVGNIDCADPHPNRNRPYHLAKRIFIGSDGAISGEEDSFYSGKQFTNSVADTIDQSVIVSYNYANGANGNPWAVHLTLDENTFSKVVTLEEGDRILRSWGLRRED